MANYDILKYLELPIFLENPINTLSPLYQNYYSEIPYKTISVPVYEYSGQISDIDSSMFSTIEQIGSELNAISASFNTSPSLPVFSSFSTFTSSPQTGSVIEYLSPSAANDTISHLRVDTGSVSSASVILGLTDYCVLISTPSNNFYVLLFQGLDRSPQLFGIDGSNPITNVVDYVGETVLNNEPYEPGGTSAPGGGGGNFGIEDGQPEADDSQEAPDGSAENNVSDSGLFTRYVMSNSTIKAFGNWLWDINYGLLVVKEAISLIYGDPMQSIISLMSFPFNVQQLTISTQTSTIYWGNFDTGLPGTILSKGSAQFDWGTIQLKEYWGNFLDYSPHTKIELYLPWCTGFVAIDPHDCLPGTLQVKTNFEFDKGTCTHIVYGNGHIIAQHSGVCGKQIPVTALDTSGKALSLVTMASSAIVSGLASGGASSAAQTAAGEYSKTHTPSYMPEIATRQRPLATAEGYAKAEAKAVEPYNRIARNAGRFASMSALAAFRTPPSVQRNGSFSGGSAGCGVQYPYIILSRPTQSVPAGYGHYYGYPSNIEERLGNLRGYTEVGEIHLLGIVATEPEMSEIDSLLKGGVII